MCFRILQPHSRRGFALPAVLAVTGVVTLIFLVAITALSSLTAEAHSARSRIRFLQRALSAEATAAYMMTTEPRRPYGIIINGEIHASEEQLDSGVEANSELTQLIRLDGHPYLIDQGGPLMARFQDQAGLINLAQVYGSSLQNLLTEIGVPTSQHSRIAARLEDYKDSDSLRQPDGAEAQDYASDWIPNRPFLSPAELLFVQDVAEQVDAKRWRSTLPQMTADVRQPIFNLNTATPLAIKVMLSANDAQVERIIAAREQAPLLNTIVINGLVGERLFWDEGVFYNVLSNSIALTFHDGQSGWTYRSRLTVSPQSLERPVWIDQTQLLEAPKRAKADTTDAVRLPYTPY